jgi:ABC-type nitrate/sulfonate/bicarbonate transport system ATPase subunit
MGMPQRSAPEPGSEVRPTLTAVQPDDLAADVQHLTKVYFSRSAEPVLALSDVSIGLRRQQVLALVGPSGCGKSTLLRILAGLDTDYQGDILWQRSGTGRPVSATVFQQDSLFPWLTVERNVHAALQALGVPRSARADRAAHYLELTGLGDFMKAYPHELSGGMRQRACFARALATEPLVLLLDEPFAALDAQTRIIMQQELGVILETVAPTVLYVTHDLEEALTVGDRVALMSARPGRISYLLDIDHGSTPRSDVMAIRARSDFRQQVADLWNRLASEVGRSLRSSRSSAGSDD